MGPSLVSEKKIQTVTLAYKALHDLVSGDPSSLPSLGSLGFPTEGLVAALPSAGTFLPSLITGLQPSLAVT